MVIADELDADRSRVKVQQVPGDPRFGNQDTDGSRSMRQFYQSMREAGAAARQMLEMAAAQQWGIPIAECQARDHQVVDTRNGKKAGFGDLVPIAATLPVPQADQLRFKDPKDRRYVGKPMPIVDLRDIIRGAAIYGIDVALPGMKYASIERCPVYGGRTASFDQSDALTVPRGRARRGNPGDGDPLRLQAARRYCSHCQQYLGGRARAAAFQGRVGLWPQRRS